MFDFNPFCAFLEKLKPGNQKLVFRYKCVHVLQYMDNYKKNKWKWWFLSKTAAVVADIAALSSGN